MDAALFDHRRARNCRAAPSVQGRAAGLKVHHAGNELVVSAYRCVGVAGRNRKNAPRPTSSLRPVVTRHVQLSNPDFCVWLLKDDGYFRFHNVADVPRNGSLDVLLAVVSVVFWRSSESGPDQSRKKPGPLTVDGAEVFAHACKVGLEGVGSSRRRINEGANDMLQAAL
jgi:hypothetical protein